MQEDRIERTIEIAAPMDRVWSVLTEPGHVGTWFGIGEATEIDLRPGGIMVLDHGDHGRYPTRFVRVEPPHVLSFRWAASFPDVLADETNSTLVEFTLAPIAAGTSLRVVESGFARLAIPPDRARSAGYESHADGWSGVLERIGELVAGRIVEPLPTAR